MKSLASCEIASKASSSKSKSARVMLAKVSASLSPMKGDNPDNLIRKGRTITDEPRAPRETGNGELHMASAGESQSVLDTRLKGRQLISHRVEREKLPAPRRQDLSSRPARLGFTADIDAKAVPHS